MISKKDLRVLSKLVASHCFFLYNVLDTDNCETEWVSCRGCYSRKHIDDQPIDHAKKCPVAKAVGIFIKEGIKKI